MKRCNKNKIIIASAGTRKTTFLVEAALNISDKNVLVTTYTNENLNQINSYLIGIHSCVPKNVDVVSWFSFLLRNGVRPYQNHMTNKSRINAVDFIAKPPRFFSETDVDNYYLTTSRNIYSDRVSEFVYKCNQRTNGLIIKRLEKIYSHIFIDEIQDFAGFDLDLLNSLFNSNISIIAVGDPRQSTYSTNNSIKNKKFKKKNIANWIFQNQKDGIISVEERTECYRCNQTICDFADALFPDLPNTKSMNHEITGHDGVFHLKKHEVEDYYKKYNPIVLRYNIRANTMNLPALNIGMVKGRTFDRVLIFPTGPMKEYLETKDISKVGDISKLYVAITRARYSVAFVV